MSTGVLVGGVSIIWGANFVVMKNALEYTTPLVLGTLRMIVAGTLLVALGVLVGAAFPAGRREITGIAVVAMCTTTLSTGLSIIGVDRVSAGLAALLSNTLPLFTVILAPLLLHERVRRGALTGLAIGFAGTAAIALPALTGRTDGFGVVCMLVSAALWSLGSVMYKRFDLTRPHPLLVLGIQLWFSAAGLALLAAVFEDVGDTRPWTWHFLVPFAWVSTIGLAVAFLVWNELLERGSAVQASATAYLVPVSGVLFGVLLRGERLVLIEVLGGALVLVGVAIVVRHRSRAEEPPAGEPLAN